MQRRVDILVGLRYLGGCICHQLHRLCSHHRVHSSIVQQTGRGQPGSYARIPVTTTPATAAKSSCGSVLAATNAAVAIPATRL